MSMHLWTQAKYEVGWCAGFSILACKWSLRVLSTLGMSHQLNCAACRNVWRELVNLMIISSRIHRVAIICGSINWSLSPLKRNIKELVKFYEIPYVKKLLRQKVSTRKNFVTCFQIMVKLLLTKVTVRISLLAENSIKFCQLNKVVNYLTAGSFFLKYTESSKATKAL